MSLGTPAVVPEPRMLRLRSAALTVTFLAITSAIVAVAVWNAPGSVMDEGGLLVYPDLVNHGLVPQRDFETFYGPLNLWLLAGLYKVFGVSIGTERVTGAIYHFSVALAGAWFASRASRLAALSAGLAVLLILVRLDLVAFAWLPASSALLGMLTALHPDASHRRLASTCIAGLLGGLAVSFRPEVFVVILIGVAPLAIRWARVEILGFTGGMLVGVIPFAIHSWLAGPGTVLHEFETIIFVTTPLRRLPLPGWRSAAFYLGLLLVFSLLAIIGRVVILIRHERTWRLRSWWPVAVLIVAVGVTYQAVQRTDVAHTSFVAAVTVPIGLTFGFESWRDSLPQGKTWLLQFPSAILISALILFAAIPVAALGEHGQLAHGAHWVTANGRSFPVSSVQDAAHVQRILDYVATNARTGDRLIVATDNFDTADYTDTYFYYLLPELRPGTRYLEWNPGSVNGPGSSLPEELAAADVVIQDVAHSAEPPALQYHSKTTAESVFHARFCEATSSGSYYVWVPCRSALATTYRD